MRLINENETVHQLISCHWSLYVAPENIKKPLVSGDIK